MQLKPLKTPELLLLKLALLFSLFLMLTNCDNSEDDSTLSGNNLITNFKLTITDNPSLSEDISADINQDDATIRVVFPSDTDLSNLMPSITISKNATISPSLDTAINLESPVTYIVTAEDDTSKTYTVSAVFDTALADREILEMLYKANPESTLNWDLNANTMDSWEGVTIADDHVKTLILISQNISIIPDEIENLSALEVLKLEDNQITELPDNIFNLSALTELNLNDNALTSLPETINKLSYLTLLQLEKNSLTEIPPAIGSMESLEYLYLNNNQLTDIPTEIGDLKNLKNFNLSYNQLESIPTEIGSMTALKSLAITNNKLSSIPTQISDLDNLEGLYLNNNELTSIPAAIGGITKLIALHLQQNQLTTVPNEVCDLENSGVTVLLDNGVTCE